MTTATLRSETADGPAAMPFDHPVPNPLPRLLSGDDLSSDDSQHLFERLVLGRLEPAATIAGFAFSPFTASTFPQLGTAITHLRDVLGDQTYELLARKGAAMTTAAMATYAYDQIDQARTELNAVSKDATMRPT